ncbi:hypothetical protein S58_61010 [Bradyrhizobium oligotrophicum S58]|uniref:Uncharacterized protein n=1 Tax=Bradyrhizobium oligotrophicum S58 TaxID=1245469 RepID=M4ZF09_9BRAD|nr:hypothetical protein [Bradyrhizobium oligotrophicum]BAM92076.1 hypothetical protein S58_61010 [Bradyrhizobium oligotrophicum S58]
MLKTDDRVSFELNQSKNGKGSGTKAVDNAIGAKSRNTSRRGSEGIESAVYGGKPSTTSAAISSDRPTVG